MLFRSIMLNLTPEELRWMKETESRIIEEGRINYSEKKRHFEQMLSGKSLEYVLLKKMEESEVDPVLKLNRSHKADAHSALKTRIRELPWNRMPVILMGGSFNTQRRATRVMPEAVQEIDRLLRQLDPEEFFFVIGHKMSGYEKYLTEQNRLLTNPFKIYAFVPSLVSREERKRLMDSDVYIRVSTESEGMGIYKSFNYEIFERRPSILIGFDGNSAGANLIQEAKNGKGHARIYVWEKCLALRQKAESLEGYVTFFGEEYPLSITLRR